MSMSRYKISAPGTVYHLYNRGNHKQEIFQQTEDYQMYRGLFTKYCKNTDFSIIAYCLMPNHVHLLVRQNRDSSPAKLISRLHTSYVMYYNKKYGKVGHLFQDRYKQKILSDQDYLLTLVCYIHLNPVKDKLSLLPENYRWSSYIEYQNKGGWRQFCDRTAIESLGLSSLPPINDQTKLARGVDSQETFDMSV